MSADAKVQTSSSQWSLPLPDRIRTSDISYRFIPPEEFGSRDIDPQDVPVGTFVAEDHPPFLASRFGGNAYGFGIVEHEDKLAPGELDFLEQVDFGDPENLKKHFRRINGIYRKLGLLIRFSGQGKRYFLIPINWVSHSLEDVRDKADEIERVLVKQIHARKKEKLTVGVLTAPNDLILHELAGRMPTQRYLVIDSIQKIRETRGPVDLMVIPKDIGELLISLDIPGLGGRTLSQQSFTTYGTYLAGKIYDILGVGAPLVVVASKPFPRTDRQVWVEFLNHDDLRGFILFSHAFRCKKRYRGKTGNLQQVHLADFYSYLSGIFVFREDLRKLAGDRDPSQLSLEEIDQVPHLDLRLSRPERNDLESRWERVLTPFFEKITCHSKPTPSLAENWQRNYIIESELPHNLQVYVGLRREPPVRLEELEQNERTSGMAGCSLALVASYKNSFDYLLSVLEILAQIRDRRFHRISELDLNRLHDLLTAPRHRYRTFHHVKQLMKQTGRLLRLETLLNPGGIEGTSTRVLEQIEKLGLLGLSPALLREIYLIVVGHSTMGRIAVGKFPEKTLTSITDQARDQSLEETVDLLRTIRLMSVAEIGASLGEHLTREQAREIFTLYDRAVRVAADPHLDWDTLHDQQIAALGGAQNLAVRQMLKIFNLFPFLDSWTELTNKGPFQKEALANYSQQTLDEINQVLALIRVTNEFKERFYGREAFGRTYFFRKLLGCQFHGTGHLFPLLGTQAGFILLWVVGNASPGNVINFNPLAGYDGQEGEFRPARVRAALEALDVAALDFDYLSGIRRALAQGRPAFVFNSGIQLRYNSVNQTTEATFIDVPGNLRRVGLILDGARSRAISDIPSADLAMVDRLFGELSSYREHLRGASAGGVGDGSVGTLNGEIGRVCSRVQEFFARRLFEPQHLYDNLEILHDHCPTIGRQLLPDFWELYRIKPALELADGETISAYVLRCLKKFQALVNKERDRLQNVDLFYHLAQEQFGPMAAESVGASNAQIEMLEGIVDRIAARPGLLKALGAAMVFQDIGKLCLYLPEYRSLSTKVSHGEAGAEMLRCRGILGRLGIDEEVSRLAEFFVEVHGLVGHVLRGDAAVTALGRVTTGGDEPLFDAFFLHSLLAAAAYQEGIMVEDLLDRFLYLRQLALRVIGGEMTWDSCARTLSLEKGRSLLEESSDEALPMSGPPPSLPEWPKTANEDAVRRRGEDVAAMERLFRLTGLADINFADVQMKILGMPVTFIYHKKGMKSTGFQTFERELREALLTYEALTSLDEEVRRSLLAMLNPGCDLVRFYGFESVSRYLEPGNRLRLLVVAIRGVDRYRAREEGTWAVDFQRLAAAVGWRHEALSEELGMLSLGRLFRDNGLFAGMTRSAVGVMVRCKPKERVVALLFQDRLGVPRICERLRRLENIVDLRKEYEHGTERLRRSAYRTEDYQDQLREVFQSRLHELLELTINRAEDEMLRQQDFSALEKIYGELLTVVEAHSSQEEQLQLVRDLFEFNRDRLRNQRLKELYRKVLACTSRDELQTLWEETRLELVGDRRHLGPEFESVVTKYFDEGLIRLSGA
jgi:hypothetical protein